RLEDVPLSGQTPLADALRRARLLLRGELVRHPNAVPLVVLVSDGVPTVPLRAGGGPGRRAGRAAPAPRPPPSRCGVAPGPSTRPGHAVSLAEAAGGTRLPLGDLAAGLLIGTVEALG